MDIQVVVRGHDQALLQHLLDTVREMGEPLSLVQMRPMGLLIPVRLAVKAGLLELPQSSEPVKPVPDINTSPRRTRSPRKKAPVEAPAPDALWEE